MFWQSVLNGLSCSLHWETYVVALICFIISSLPVLWMVVSKDNSEERMLKGGCAILLLQPLVYSLTVFIAVCTLFPFMLGGTEAAWALPWALLISEPGRTLIVFGVMVVLSFLGSFIPILGQSNSFLMFISWGVVVIFLTLLLDVSEPGLNIEYIRLVPDFLTIVGIVIVSGIASLLGTLAASWLATSIFKEKEHIAYLIVIPLNFVFGLIPVFIYGAWIGLQIRGLS